MSLFFQEWKKIWRPGILAVLCLLGAMYYYMFSAFYIKYFCNGPTAQVQFDLAVEWVEKYGPTMEPPERAELDSRLAEEIEAFDEQLPTFPGAAELGLTDYWTFQAGYLAYYNDMSGQRDTEVEQVLNTVMYGSNYYTIKKLENYMANYDWFQETPWDELAEYEDMSPARQARLLELEAGGRGFLPLGVVTSTVEYAGRLAVWIVLSIVLLLSPTLVRDRLHRMRAAQWASRRGRRVLNVQFTAGVCSAFVLAVVELVIYAVPFVAVGPLKLAECPLFDWTMPIYTWFDGTYGQYLIVLVLLLLALGTAAGALTVFFSQYSGSYVAMLLKAIPLFIALGPLFGAWLMDRPFWFRRVFSLGGVEPELPRNAEAACAAVLLAAGTVLLLTACRRQRKRELAA